MDASRSLESDSTCMNTEKGIKNSSCCPKWLLPLLDQGEMAQRIWQFNWSSTPLGPIESWPQSLCFWVDMILTNKFAMTFSWGEDYTVFYNDAFIPIAGDKHPGMLGHSRRSFYMEIWDTIILPYYNYLRTGQSMMVENHYFSLLRFGYLEEMYASICNSPLRNDQGEIEGFLSTLSETTLQVLGERRLWTLRDLGSRASDARNPWEACRIAAEAFAGNTADIPFALIYLLDDSRQQTELAAASGITPEHPASPKQIDLQDEGEPWPFQRIISSGEIIQLDNLETQLGPLPGGPWPESSQSALVLPLKSQTQERAIGFLVTGISPRRRCDEQYLEFLTLVAAQVATAISNAQAYEQERQRADALVSLDQAKTAFFNNISHEFRTPLTLILGLLEGILQNGQLPAENYEHLEVAYHNALRLLKLVNTLLDFSRIEAYRMQASYQPVQLDVLTTDLASNFRSAVESMGLSLVVDCPPLPEPVYVDPDMWEKIVLNLLSNALKHTFEGQIEVRLTWKGQSVELTVRDTGVGIPAEFIPHLFERFHRVPNMRARTYEGTGIGLALVWELVKLHSGTVTVQSVLSEGSVFTVSIPTGTAHVPADHISTKPSLSAESSSTRYFVKEALQWLPQQAPVSAPPSPTTREGMHLPDESSVIRPRVVLADDNADMLAYVKRLLDPFYEVIAVSDGEAALESIRAQQPDLVLTDVMMPGLDGFGLLQAIRADSKTRLLPVIMLSARAGEEASIEGREAGADDYLMKPFSSHELLARVKANLTMAHLRHEAEEKLHQAEKMKMVGQLAGGVAHDFNSMLTVLFGRLDMLNEHISDAEGKRLLNSALGVAERSARLVKQILAFARKQALQLDNIDLNDMIENWQELFAMTVGKQNRLKTQLAETLCPVRLDINQLETMLLNVLLNARDAMPSGGTVTISTNSMNLEQATDELAVGNYVRLSIEDTGTGMSEEVLSQAFAPFFTTKGIGEGTGLGLSQVYGTARQLGGTAQLHSVLGQGTRLDLILPCTS